MPDTYMEWIVCGFGVALLLYGLLCGIYNWCIFFYNVVHLYIRRDGKHSSFVGLVPAFCILVGCALVQLPEIWWLLLFLDGEIVPFFLFPFMLCLRALRWLKGK